MDSQDLRQSGGLSDDPCGAPGERQAPPSLLASVMRRVSQLDPYLAPVTSTSALDDARWEVRAVAIHALAVSGHGDSLAPFQAALTDEHPAVRAAAVRAVVRLGAHAPLDQLALALRDADDDVRLAVAEALGDLGVAHAQPVRPLLALALRDAQAAVRAEARLALERSDAAELAHAAEPVPRSHIQMAAAHHLWQVFLAQSVILQRRWLPVAVLLFLCDALVLLVALGLGRGLHETSTLLALVTTVAAAVGIAYAANARHDTGLELALATATSARMLLYCRFVLVISSTILLSGAASAVIAVVYGQGFWGIVQLWLGPVLLASSLALALVLMVGSWLSVLLISALEALQTLRFGPDHQILFRDHSFLLQTNPLIVGLALLCLALVFVAIPRQIPVAPRVTDLW
jgi:HEAT repeats